MIHLSPADHQIHSVTNFHGLVSTPFNGVINAICWTRTLTGNFSEIVEQVVLTENMVVLEEDDLLNLQLSEQGQLAREVLLNDLKLLKAHGASPTLNVIRCYDRDDTHPFFPTDVYSFYVFIFSAQAKACFFYLSHRIPIEVLSTGYNRMWGFHVDRSPVPTDTFLCTYHGAPSEILPNEQARQKVLVPEIREELKKLYGGAEEGFESFLSEHFFDLHYQANPGARPISLGLGHLWRLAIDHPESEVVPCVHRAPEEKNGERRLLVIC